MRGGGRARLSQGFQARVNRAIDGEPVIMVAPAVEARRSRWWRPFAGAAIAAGVAAIAVFALQQRALVPALAEAPAQPREALSYTVPTALSDPAMGQAPTAMPATRLTSYVFAHSKYSSVLGQSNVLSELLTDADDTDVGTAAHAPSP